MNLYNRLNINSVHIIFFIIAVFLILPKWILSFVYFDEDIILRIIHEATDTAYFPIINSFSDFKFSESFSKEIMNLKLISYPIIGLSINSLFFKIFGGYSFIFLEIVCTFLFLFLFYNIFLKLNFLKATSISLAIIFLILPNILNGFNFLEIKLLKLLSLNFESFYSTRFPRPAISNLFLFVFIYCVIKFYKEDENYLRIFFWITVLIGLTINFFFYLAFIELFLILFIFFLKFKKKVFKILIVDLKFFFYCLLILLLFILIFQLQVYFSEPDYIKRLGVFSINSNQKRILFEYLFKFLLSIEFILLFFFNTFFFFLLKNNFIKIFYYFFLASIFSPVLFFAMFNKGVDYYHFFNWIVIFGFIFPFLALVYLIETKFLSFLKKFYQKLIIFLLVIVSIFYFNFDIFFNHKNTFANDSKRYKLSEVTNFIGQNKLFLKKDLKILNFHYKLSVWLLLNDFNNFSLIPVSFWSPKTDDILEVELISSLKLLNLTKIDFYNLIKNQKSSWRFKNDFVYNYFGRKYLANSLVSFNDNKFDYEDTEKKFIQSNNLLISHQVIIPKSEIKRLLNKFDTLENQAEPDVVIIDEESKFINNRFSNKNYCLIFTNNNFKIYSHIKLINECKIIKN